MKALNLKKQPTPTGKSSKTGKSSHGMTIAALTLALGTAVYLNWSFAQHTPMLTANGVAENEEAVEVFANTSSLEPEKALVVFDPLNASEVSEGQNNAQQEIANKNYGEAQLVSVNKDSGAEFFEQARLTRSKARDEALEALESALKRSGLTQEEKDSLTTQLSAQLSNVTKESDLETLIKAKGFADCVVMLTASAADVTVMTENDALTAVEVTQIRDVVLSRCPNLSAQDITVVEVK